MFSYEFCEIFKNSFFTEHLQTIAFVNSKNILIAFWNLYNTYLAKHLKMLDSTHKEIYL